MAAKRLNVAFVLISVVTLMAFAIAIWSVKQGHSAACDRANKSMDVLSSILMKTEPTPIERRFMTPKERKRSDSFYRFAFQQIDDGRC